MRQDDFVDIMKEVVPQLIEQTVLADDRAPAVKRPSPAEDSPSADVSEPASSRARISEVLSVQDCTEL